MHKGAFQVSKCIQNRLIRSDSLICLLKNGSDVSLFLKTVLPWWYGNEHKAKILCIHINLLYAWGGISFDSALSRI